MSEQSSSLNSIISPEIKNDEFYDYIQRIAQEENIKYILEIGSSSGEGSTEAFVKGIRNNPNQPTLFCMEVSQIRFEQLNKRYEKDEFVQCYNVSSVSIEKFPSETDVIEFYNQQQSGLNYYPLEQVLGWLQQDIEYIKSSQVETNGIEKIKQDHNIDYFDVVLIDGSEFTGVSELKEVYGANLILLDDINTFKNHNNYHQLFSDSEYILVDKNINLRNGYAVFRKKTFSFEPLFNRRKPLKLELGASEKRMEGWTTVDLDPRSDLCLDLSKPLPFQDNCLEEIYSSHLLEHFYYPNPMVNLLSECYRVLKPGGVFKVAVPNARIYIEAYEKPESFEAEEHCLYKPAFHYHSKIDFINYIAYMDGHHRFLFDEENLPKIITNAGFENVRLRSFESGLDLEARKHESIYAEGKKPLADTNSLIDTMPLSVHFFTIVLNGEPFIRYHIDVLSKLSFKWHWHIIEGVADLKHDTSWSLQLGGKLTDQFHDHGRSKDGTSQYLDQLAKEYPENITIYRQPKDIFWDGKREMVNAPLSNIQEECLLWQIDVDELWTVEQIYTTRQMFITHPEKTAAFYWCWYFVGENLLISTRNCYAENPQQDWLRTWRFKPGMVWAAHEPPILVETLPDSQQQNVASINPFLHHETEQQGLVFQHFAYVMPEQLQFKEEYYGYQNALTQWQNLQSATQFPVFLREYFAWVQDQTQVKTATACGITPIAYRDNNTKTWEFRKLETCLNLPVNHQQLPPKILIDGVFFQLYNTGIARVWRSLLEEWENTSFGSHIVILDRDGTAPQIPGLWYRTIPAYDYNHTDTDSQMLQQVCDQENADLFISTYYTTPISTPSVFMAYDMIPEILGANFNEPMWREKHRGILHASAYIAISENTATDLVKYFPEIGSSVTVAHCGISSYFYPAPPGEIIQFKTKYGINKPYFLLVGAGSDYKNAVLFFQGFAQLQSKTGFDVVCTGTGYLLGTEFRELAAGSIVHSLYLSDEELRAAYSGATALVYPSKYEGFGMPVAEALACGCPVITCPNSSIPEVAGEAAIYIKDDDIDAMTDALCEVQKLKIRNSLIAKGLEQAKQFSWSKMADTISSALINATLIRFNLREINLVVFPDWNQPEEVLYPELVSLIKSLAIHPNCNQMTLLIDHQNISDEDANLALSSVMMNLLMEEELELDDSVEIVLIGQLNSSQWSALCSQLQGRIKLNSENQEAIAFVGAEIIPVYDLEH
ncbi:glycosyl transferase group 1 [Planktothrix agardhii CCAP 1459/11A]|uniref:Glycosyl transferase group 1 n=1 Tax=Planktothrix agardhii CCAP 1459/11A TaxID=282420 RepID=A0A479ZNJ6_PLAAG|nr:glycosyltransferase [Planktothrix agardhii]GCL34209.1 glycosyl transferase group 1 [Planktothrix agardhii CCAP 1459/11A]